MALRLDRLATLYVARPLQRLTSANQRSIPILMYHSIADEDESGVHPYYRTTTSPARFAEQMKHLHEEGYKSCSLAQAVGQLHGDRPTAEKFVVITFDDGFRDFYCQAFPVLSRFGFTATMFLPTSYIGEVAVSFKGKDCLTWVEIRELNKFGVSFGSHTVTHPQLHDCDAESIKRQIVGSKQAIEQELGYAVQSFSCPYAFPEADHRFKKMLRTELHRARYENGVCTTVGRPKPGSDPFFLKRLPVNSDDDPQLFRAKLAGSYDWLATPQYLVKLAKTWAPAESHQ